MNSVSAALTAAQERLTAMRNALRTTHSAERKAVDTPSPLTTTLPNHLGWGSQVIRTVLPAPSPAAQPHTHPQPSAASITTLSTETVETQATQASASATIRVQPDILAATMRHERSAEARVWLLLRHLNTNGSGVIAVSDARAALCNKASAFYSIGWRQLRRLLQQGREHFWQRDQTRIWLYSAARVASKFKLGRLQTHPVALPIKQLIGSIDRVRAAFYAAFHSGRDARPIARATLHRVCGVSPNSQRRYERLSGIQATTQFGLLSQTTTEAHWQHGGAVFHLIDHRGQHGPVGRKYLARQLPNRYSGALTALSKHSQRIINRRLSDLTPNGTLGNGQTSTLASRRYCQNGRTAVRTAQTDTRWFQSTCRNVWYVCVE